MLGGGVAEMLHALLPYVLDAGIDARWVVLQERAEFFELTKDYVRPPSKSHAGRDPNTQGRGPRGRGSTAPRGRLVNGQVENQC